MSSFTQSFINESFGAQGYISTGKLVISIGSSLTQHGLYDTASHFGYALEGVVEWALILSGWRCRYINRGVSGQTTTQMIARLQDDVLVHDPFIVIAQNGTNEINDGYASVVATCKTMYDSIIQSGAKLIVTAIQSRNAAVWTTSQILKANAVNEFKRRYCERNTNAYFVDITKYVTDPSNAQGDALSGMLRDGTHYTPAGAYAAAIPLQVVLEDLLPYSDPTSTYVLAPDGSDFVYGNEINNPLFTGTGGVLSTGFSGSVPTDWRAERVSGTTTGTGVCSVAAASALDPTIEWATVFTAGAGGDEAFYLRTNASTMTPSLIGKYEALIKIDVSAWDGWKEIQFEIDDQAVGGKTYHGSLNAYNNALPEHAWSGVLRTPVFDVTDVGAGVPAGQRFRVRVMIDGAAAGTGTIKLSKPVLRAIDPDTTLTMPTNEATA